MAPNDTYKNVRNCSIELLRQAFIEKPLMTAITFCFTKKMVPFKKTTIKMRDFIFGK